MDFLNLDYESASEVNLKTKGLDLYAKHPSTRVLMASYAINHGSVQQYDATAGYMPAELRDALTDPHVEKWAFNAQFERTMTQHVLKINSPIESWRCTMVLAYMLGFNGDLLSVGRAMGLKNIKTDGLKLIKAFSEPQRVTKNQPHKWRDRFTDPELWQQFLEYNWNDTVAEMAIHKHLIKFPILQRQWRLYALDQKINDYGIQINTRHARGALALADPYKDRITAIMSNVTQLPNPNSPAQLLPWLQERGYPFQDIRKDTVSKVLSSHKKDPSSVDAKVVEVLQLRGKSGKSSLAKYKAMIASCGYDEVFRYSLQYYGAQRTGRWAGRRLQTQNFTRTPKILENDRWLTMANQMIEDQDLDGLELLVGDPMIALVGCIRSALVARPGYELRVADLSSIESVVIGWLTDCEWMLGTLKAGRDLYRAFAEQWLKIPYEDTKPHRSNAKPATLGAGFRLGGGDIVTDGKEAGKKTGLWGYAENMGIELTRDQSHSSVKAFRELCPEIVDYWSTLENAAMRCIRMKTDVTAGKVTFEYRKPFMCILLPSGRRLYYFDPRIEKRTVKFGDKSYEKQQVSYMGKPPSSTGWVRIVTHGGKLIENIVQAIACDILCYGMLRADKHGFRIAMHVHDEIITEAPIEDTEHTVERLIELMTAAISWAPGLPLGAAGWAGPFYKKD
jgi:DNA polymerase